MTWAPRLLGVTLGIFWASWALAASAPVRYLMLLNHAPLLTRDLKPEQVLHAQEDVAVVAVPDALVEKWSERVHHELGGCGGFLDVTDEIRHGRSAAALVGAELLNRLRPEPRPDYRVRGTPEIAALVARADGDRLWNFLTELTNFPDRSATSASGKEAAEFLKTRATGYAGHLPGFTTETVATGAFYGQPSVVATLPGTDPTLPAVVIGGHMDTFTAAKPGADDDGSGSAVVMEALRAIAVPGARFKRTIHFIWYAAEERGLVGSKYVVDHFKSQGRQVHAAIQFDMVGWNSPKDNEDVYLITDNTNAALNQTLRQIIQGYTTVKVGETKCGYACSDHANWHRAGIPVVFPFESSFSNMNQKLHTGDDKIAYLDKAHALNFARIALGFLGELAELQ